MMRLLARCFAMAPAVLACLTLSPNASAADDPMEQLARPIEGRSRRVTSTFRQGADNRYDRQADPKGDLEEGSNHDNFRIAPGATHVLMDEKGPGEITHIWMTFLGPEKQPWAPGGSANHQEMLLRIYWDGRERPGVEAPVGDFFANAFGRRDEVISTPIVVEDADSYNCFWHMPFRKSARVEIVNQSTKPISLLYYNIDWIEKPSLPDDTPYFHAQYRQEYPVEQGKDYVVLETQGKGHYVGTFLAVRTRSPSWFGEGDEKIFIDGEAKPSIWGTGTEDYFLSAWGLKRKSTPTFGVPYFDQWGIVGGHTSAYRWHLSDPIVFNTGIKVTFEHFGWIAPDENPQHKSMSWNERQDDYASVAYWYQTGEPTFTARAPDGAARRLPSLDRVIAFGRDVTDPAHHVRGTASAQDLDIYPDGPQLFFRPESPDDSWVEIPFEVAASEPLRLLIQATKSYDFGRFQPSLDGVPLGDPIDLYSPEITSQEFHLLDFWPEPGRHVLRLQGEGKNPASSGYCLGLESVRLRERRPRVAEYAHERDRDWRKDPVLHP
jgi:hypothetical protein